jgi:hypothetical protein
MTPDTIQAAARDRWGDGRSWVQWYLAPFPISVIRFEPERDDFDWGEGFGNAVHDSNRVRTTRLAYTAIDYFDSAAMSSAVWPENDSTPAVLLRGMAGTRRGADTLFLIESTVRMEGAAAQTLEPYFPQPLDSRLGGYRNSGVHLSQHLRAFREPRLQALDSGAMSYRVMILPSFSSPFLVRITHRGTDTWVVTKQTDGGDWEYLHGQLARADSSRLTDQDWTRWAQLVDSLAFWEHEVWGATLTLDGYRMFFEGIHGWRHHATERGNPASEDRAFVLGQALLRLGDIDLR